MLKTRLNLQFCLRFLCKFLCILIAVPCFVSGRHSRARFGETDFSSYLCNSRKRKSAGFSSFRVLGANYPI